MSTKRNYHFDNIKALLIFLVVFGHLIEPLRDINFFGITYFIIYSFHMPLFIFMAGYFAKPTTKGLMYLFKKFIKFEIIYALVFVVLFATSGGEANVEGSALDLILYALQPIWVLWYLLSLIFWRFLLIAFEKHPVAIGIIIALIIGFNFIPFDFRVLSLGRTLSFFPYFIVGYLAKKHQFDFSRLRHSHTITFYLLCLLVVFWAMYSTQASDELLYGTDSIVSQGTSLLPLAMFKINTYLVAAAATIVILNFVPTTKNTFTAIGQKTLPIFLWHGVFIFFLQRINFFEQIRHFNNILSYIILFILAVLLVLFLKDRKV
ncbi:acyltransferase family protein [Mollicutes bacterium LVI A0039]|nr:acyltransferase family protein [Mollicutes bacterium LVI A0039]